MPLYEGLGGIGLINEKNTTVVLDLGAAYTKAGFAGEYGPRIITRSEVKCRETGQAVPVFQYKNQDELRHHIVDFIHKLYFRNLLVNPKDRRVVIVENLLCSSVVRDTLAKVLFRHYEVLSVLFVPSHLVALMTLGISTGLVLDLGHKEATLMPIYEGVVVFQAWQALPLGGRLIERSLSELLLDRAVAVTEDGSEHRLSAIMKEIPEKCLEDIKVRTCFVTTLERSSRLQSNKYDRSLEPPPPPSSVQYPLEGHHILTVPGTVREMAAEALFERDEDALTLATMVLDALLKCPIDTRHELAENLLILGGTASMKGMKHRILAEVRATAASEQYRHRLPIASFKIHHPPAKDNYVAWLGGAILGATEAVMLRSLPREQYLAGDVLPDWCNLTFNTRDDRDEKFA
ncbi:actin-related protein 10-like [Eriocheir sinensis]|uniref:actin-related protein 10-like n=1 Tax=Eriocheir sinensis TaxID=95602 RepID=UPI0021C8C8D8|nr:actin-related protein 10-like [Eriocheir sinensis]